MNIDNKNIDPNILENFQVLSSMKADKKPVLTPKGKIVEVGKDQLTLINISDPKVVMDVVKQIFEVLSEKVFEHPNHFTDDDKTRFKSTFARFRQQIVSAESGTNAEMTMIWSKFNKKDTPSPKTLAFDDDGEALHIESEE